MSNFCDRLREERERLGLTQEAFGAVGGVKKQAQLKYEKGERSPDGQYLAAVSKIGVDIQYVITGERSASAISDEMSELIGLYQAAPLAVKHAVLGALTAGSQGAGSDGIADNGGDVSLTVKGRGHTVAGRNIVKK